jgi:large repetitive protein
MQPIGSTARGIMPTAAALGFGTRLSRHARVRKALVVLSSVLIAASCGDDPTSPEGSISIETTSLAEAIEGLDYSQHLEAAGGSGGYSWLLAAGSLPAGLTLAPGGAISGTPVAPGTSSFRVRATDVAGRTATADLTIDVVQALAVHTGALPEGVMGEAYTMQLEAVGGRGTRTWSMTGGDAAAWLSISSTGELSGTPAASGASTVTVAVADESGQQATRQLPVVVLDPLAVAAIGLPTATQGRVYAAQLVATGGDGLYAWDVESGALPTGVALGSVGGLTGIPEEAGVFTFTARVKDRGDRVATRALTLAVERAPTIQTTSLPPGGPGEPYSAQLVATGGTGGYAWSVTEGALPDGLTLSAAGALSGTPTTLGSNSFTVQVTDEASATHARGFTIVVAEVEVLVNGVPVTGIAGDAGSVRFYGIEVPEGATQLTVAISGGTGDVDLYVRRGSLPAQYAYDCRPLREGNDEICTFSPPFLTAGDWYIMLRGHSAYTGVSLVASHDG